MTPKELRAIRKRRTDRLLYGLPFPESQLGDAAALLAEVDRLQVEVAKTHALLAAAKAGLDIAEGAQGEWSCVLYPYAPEWTEPFRRIVEVLEPAIAAAEAQP